MRDEDQLGCDARARLFIDTRGRLVALLEEHTAESHDRSSPSLWYASQPTFFRVEWEWNKCMEGASGEPPSIKKLLLVEDDIATAARLGEMLAQQAGYQVIVASDFVTAMKFLRSFKPDLVLLDERLLTWHGTDLLPRLHLMKDLQNIPLLLLTARWVPDERPALEPGSP